MIIYLQYGHLITLHSLNLHRKSLQETTDSNATTAAGLYVVAMTSVIGLTIPGATILSFLGGMLFPQPWSSIYAYCGFVLGAAASYWAVKYLLKSLVGEWLTTVTGYRSFEEKLKKNAFAYLIFARYTLVFPFWFVNGAAAMVGVPFGTFMAATAIAVIPGAIIYTTAGRALSTIMDSLDEDGVKNLKVGELLYETILNDQQLRLLLGMLVFVAVVPFVVKKVLLKKNKQRR